MTNPDVAHPQSRVRVWDLFVRLFHWSLVLSMVAAWFTSSGRDETHQWIGLIAATLVALRLIWGFAGSHFARFGQFVKGPLKVLTYLAAIMRGTEKRYIGHNPAGGAMVIILLAAVCATATTGYLMTTDAYYGDEFMQGLHSICAYGTVALILIHVGGVILASVRHKENLVVAMFSGEKRAAEHDDVA
jgi:cytochrome b